MGPWAVQWMHQDVFDLLAAFAVVGGLSLCLFGYRLWRAVAALGGWAGGFLAGAAYAAAHAPEKFWIIIGLGAAAGCALMVLLALFDRMALFIAFAWIGGSVGIHLGQGAGIDGGDLFACGLVGALIASVTAVVFDRVAVVLLSVAAGGLLVVWGAALFWGWPLAEVTSLLPLLEQAPRFSTELRVAGLLAGIGFALQFVTVLMRGPDAADLRRAREQVDLPRQRRLALLDELYDDGLITRSEHLRQVIRIVATPKSIAAERAPGNSGNPARAKSGSGPSSPAASGVHAP